MKRKKAIAVLQDQIKKLEAEEFDEHSSWMAETRSYLVDFLGDADVIVEKYRGIVGEIHRYGISNYNMNAAVAGYRSSFKAVRVSACGKIEHVGLLKTDRPNFLSQITTERLLGIFFSVLAVGFTAGSIYGKYLSDTQNIELKTENKKLKDSISVRLPPSPQPTKNDTNAK